MAINTFAVACDDEIIGGLVGSDICVVIDGNDTFFYACESMDFVNHICTAYDFSNLESGSGSSSSYGTTIFCSGDIVIDPNGVPLCSTGWLSQAFVPPFEPTQIDPVVATTLVIAGLSVVAIPGGAAWGIAIILRSIKLRGF